MSNDLMQAAEAVKTHGRVLRAVIKLADEVEKLGSIDQAEAEAQQRLDATKQKVDAITDVLNNAKQQLADTDASITAAQAKAEGIVADAKVNAESIIATANDTAQGIVAKANADASSIGETIATKQSALDTINVAIGEQQDVLDGINEKLAAVKTQAAAIAG